VTETTESRDYFEKLEAEGVLLSQQRNWYVKKAEQQGDDMKREFPSTPEEAFEASIEGAYFATKMAEDAPTGKAAFAASRPQCPVDTSIGTWALATAWR
jgi:hypothetical protein